ncbi:MAG: YicC family protein [Odoribacteraceae bacterium]|jgi:uncharacterized protein (TIGR00255 family)|nr:YicC family protein [Odoribacteraceae bacterium]
MIKSMTGFGKITVQHEEKKVVIEVKSLNSKQLDLTTRLPGLYKEKEIEIRGIIKDRLERGKIDLAIYFDNAIEAREMALNHTVIAHYYRQALEVAATLDVQPDKSEILQTIMRLPDALQVKSEEFSEEEWQCLREGIEAALEELNHFREQEGEALMKDILHRISLIETFAAEVPRFEERRVEVIKQRLLEKMKEWGEVKNIDENRLEQELVYYLEKLDITEEKTRLAQHCRYFIETARGEAAPGRKLGFIAQEIGREINTMGAKANDHDIQKLVVNMKDELEKIKEQTLNLL